MKFFGFLVVVWLLGQLIIFVRQGESFSLLDALPYVERADRLPAFYDLAALVVLVMAARGLAKLTRKNHS